MDEAKFRAGLAAELRAIAQKVERLPLADRRDPEKPVHEKLTLARELRARANSLVREMAPPEGGLALAKVVFGKTGCTAQVERGQLAPRTPRARRPGRIGLALAA